MNSRSLNATKVFAWPDAEVAVMGARRPSESCTRKLAATADDEREVLHDKLAEEHERIAGGWIPHRSCGRREDRPGAHPQQASQALAEAPRAAAGTRTFRCSFHDRTFDIWHAFGEIMCHKSTFDDPFPG